MSPSPPPRLVIVVCSVLQAEVAYLCRQHWPTLPLRRLDSMLHMRPPDLAGHLNSAVDEELAGGYRVVLVYGDCCSAMAAMESRPGVGRVRANNCCDMLLGRAEYRRLARAGAYFLLPEWTQRWQEIFQVHLGLNPENAQDLMRDMHRKLVYLDTGITPVPESHLQACSHYCGLPYEILPVSLSPLQEALRHAIEALSQPTLAHESAP